MGTVKIFYKDSCPLCPVAKKLKNTLEEQNIGVQDYNVETAEGLAEATYYRVMALPSIFVEDEAENWLGEWRGNVPGMEEVMSIVNSR
jgi:glutaredoxin